MFTFFENLASEEKVIVIDTSFLYATTNYDVTKIASSNRLVIPTVVIEELDKHKKGFRSQKARSITNCIINLKNKGVLTICGCDDLEGERTRDNLFMEVCRSLRNKGGSISILSMSNKIHMLAKEENIPIEQYEISEIMLSKLDEFDLEADGNIYFPNGKECALSEVVVIDTNCFCSLYNTEKLKAFIYSNNCYLTNTIFGELFIKAKEGILLPQVLDIIMNAIVYGQIKVIYPDLSINMDSAWITGKNDNDIILSCKTLIKNGMTPKILTMDNILMLKCEVEQIPRYDFKDDNEKFFTSESLGNSISDLEAIYKAYGIKKSNLIVGLPA